jgi:hypothetical protein
MPTIDFTDKEHAAVTAAIRHLIEEDRFPPAPRLVPLRSALAKPELTPERQRLPKASHRHQPEAERGVMSRDGSLTLSDVCEPHL